MKNRLPTARECSLALARHYTILATRSLIGANNTTGPAHERYRAQWRSYCYAATAALSKSGSSGDG